MTMIVETRGPDLLANWLNQQHTHRPARTLPARTPTGTVRLSFAFYARISTEDFQDPASSLHWQRTSAEDLINGHGRIVAEYFDIGCSPRPKT